MKPREDNERKPSLASNLLVLIKELKLKNKALQEENLKLKAENEALKEQLKNNDGMSK